MEKTFNKRERSTNEMTVYGIRPVMEAIKSGKEIDKILVQKDLKDDASKRLINIISFRYW